MKIETALILCAGYGKRVKPLTDGTPKPLLKIWFLRSPCKNNGFYKGLADLDAKYLIFPCILSNY